MMACRANNTQVDSCTFSGNAAGQEAGAVFFGNLQYSGLILNSTFVNNSAGARHGQHSSPAAS